MRKAGSPTCKAEPPELERERTSAAAHNTASPHERGHGRAAFVLDAPTVATASLTTTGTAEHIAPLVLSLAHWDRILEGELYATSSRLDWRTLLKRTFEHDLRLCVRCGGSLIVRAAVTDPASIRTVLAALRRPPAPPTAA